MSATSIAAKREAGAAIRASAPKQEIRFPRKVTFTEIEALPRLAFGDGSDCGVFISRERDGSRYYSLGISFIRADAGPVTWQATSWDNTMSCLTGRFRMLATDSQDRTVEYTVEAGEHFWAPAGYRYTTESVGVEATVQLTNAPQMPSGWRYTGDDQSYSDVLVAQRPRD